MSENYPLKPFPAASGRSPYAVSATLDRQGRILAMEFALTGALAELHLPELAVRPERRDELWQQTCFEFFLARPDGQEYWECNLSPAGHWNLYHFSDYRQGMVEELAVAELPVRICRQPKLFHLALVFDLSWLGAGADSWQLGVSAVVREKTGPISYWALSHPGSKPDFHHRGAFLLTI